MIDEAHETAVVAGTILDTVRDKETGQELVQVSAGIALAHLHTIDHKVEATAQPVILRIPGRDGTEATPDAPGAVFLGGVRGGFVVFSNGASAYSLSISDGALSELEVIPGDAYSRNNFVSVAAVDKDTNVVVLSHNLIENNHDGEPIQKTSLLFYSLKDDGSFSALKTTDSNGFPEGTFLSEGSQVAIATDDSGKPTEAMVITNEGSFWVIDLETSPGGSLTGQARRIAQFPALAQGSAEAGPRLLKFFPSTNTVVASRLGGVTLRIQRPVFGRPGRSGGIQRPVFVRSQESPKLVVAQLNNKGTKLVSSTDLSDAFEGERSLSELIAGPKGWFISAYSGSLFVVDLQAQNPTIDLLGEIGPRIESVAYNVDRFVAISPSEDEDDTGGAPEDSATPLGNVVIATIKDGKNSPIAFSISQMPSTSAARLGSVITSIRRPCNAGR